MVLFNSYGFLIYLVGISLTDLVYLEMPITTIKAYLGSDDYNSSILKDAPVITAGFDDGDLVRLK
jgi:hypothetical protein